MAHLTQSTSGNHSGRWLVSYIPFVLAMVVSFDSSVQVAQAFTSVSTRAHSSRQSSGKFREGLVRTGYDSSTTYAIRSIETESRRSVSTELMASAKFKNFDEMLSTFEEPILVDFHATWCGPCRIIHKELELVKDKLGGEMKFFKVDTEKFPSIGSRFGIQGLPTVMLFKGGQPIHSIVGVATAEEIMRQMHEYL
eukprot:CAMPEP_0195509644 /NCGR_PEP_ID=MMETSP0794_2-20130614/2521_1 /TAXON_ID=515487 /ORGANISM="Stephanopyxis turris, Strain CCMP 815" /LENGTH=194 /DNA_ID=CAMNT_0040636921 /DNA_START=235 /DNA_END=819 /DNA_ORIENTATION=-